MEEKTGNITVRQATQWFVRLRAPDCSAANREEFNRWLALSAENERAYAAVERTSGLLSDKRLTQDPRLRRLAANALGQHSHDEPGDGREEEPSQRNQTPVFSRWKNGIKTLHRYAAAFLIALTLSVVLATHDNQTPRSNDNGQRFVNNEMRLQRIELSDGSVVFLDVGAEVSVEMNDHKRRLELMNGRAYFDVAHDAFRPFLVQASNTKVQALGTRFEVDISSNGLIDVTLAEGSVAVSYQQAQHESDVWRDVLEPGDQLTVDNAGRRDSRAVNADAVTSWSRGLLVFDDTPLQRALEEINRYAEVKVRLSDESLAGISIGGNFVAGGDSSEFVRTLTTALPLKSIRTGPYEIVLFQRIEVGDSR